MPACGQDRVIFVDESADQGGDGSSWEDAFQRLQDAIEITRCCTGPVEIRVAEGTYTPVESSSLEIPQGCRYAAFILYDQVAIRGGYPEEGCDCEPNPSTYTTLLSGDIQNDDGAPSWTMPYGPFSVSNNGNNSYHVLTQPGDDDSAHLEGVTVTGGQADGSGTYAEGGGVAFTGELEVVDCQFEYNFSNGNGAALRAGTIPNKVLTDEAKLILSNCRLYRNRAEGLGAVDFFASKAVTGTVIDGCTFNENTAFLESSLGGSGQLTISDTVFLYNASSYNHGSGVMHWTGSNSHIICRDTLFLGNRGSSLEGGVATNDRSTFINCVFSGNIGGQAGTLLDAEDDTLFANCTFANNLTTSSGTHPVIAVGTSDPDEDDNPVVLSNCVFWNDGVTDTCEYIDDLGSSTQVQLNNCRIAGWTGSLCSGLTLDGSGNGATADPVFVWPEGWDGVSGTIDDDLRLAPDSVAIDAGANALIPQGTATDVLGRARRRDVPTVTDTGTGDPPIVDAGAFEFTCVWDLTGDGVVNLFDVNALTNYYGCSVGTGNGFCDRADVTADGSVNAFDYNAILSHHGDCPGLPE